MKRIKAMNGYTIMQAVTARDEDMYNCEIGCYNVYFSSDIRDYGLTNSYPEYENVDSLEVAEMHCMGNYARAREIVENRTTCATYEEIEEVMEKLDNGMTEIEIEEEEEQEEEQEEENATETIKAMERTAWTELKQYQYNHAPRTTNTDTQIEWEQNDQHYCELMFYWSALYELMQKLGIESEFNEEAMEYSNRYYDECKKTEEPTETAEEPKTTYRVQKIGFGYYVQMYTLINYDGIFNYDWKDLKRFDDELSASQYIDWLTM